MSSHPTYRGQRQERIGDGLEPRATSAEAAEFAATKRCAAQRYAELAVANKAVQLLAENTDSKGGSGRFA